MKTIKLIIATPERVTLEAMVDQVTIPTTTGEITILPGHVPLVGIIKPGELMTKTNGIENSLAVAGGFFEINDNEVKVLADSAEHATELDLAIVEAAQARAEADLAEARNKEDVDYTALAANLERELARGKVARKHHTKHNVHIDSAGK